MGDDVNEGFAFERVVGGSPVSDVFDAVFFEEFRSVLAEAAEEVVELAFESVVDAEFEDGGRRLLRCVGKCCGRQKGRGG